MRRSRLPSIRRQLIGLVLAIVAPLIAATVWIAWRQYDAQRHALGQSMLGTARALSAAADSQLGGGVATLQALAESNLLDEERFGEFHRLAARIAHTRPGAWVVLFDASGQALVNTLVPFGAPLPNVFLAAQPPAAPDELPSGSPETVRVAISERRVVYSDVFIGAVAKRPVVRIDVPVVREGAVRYCASLVLPVESFQRLVDSQNNVPEGSASLVDRRGFMIAHALNPERFIGKPVSMSLREAMQQSAEAFGRGQPHEGTVVLHAFTRSPVSGWTAVVSLPEDAGLAPIRRSMWEWALAASLLLAAGLAMTIWIARRIARPMRQLAQATETLQRNEPAAIPPVHTRELAQLAHAIAGLARRSDERLKLATDAVPALISYIDKDLRYRLINRTYEEWFGHAREEILGRHMKEVLGEPALGALRPHIESALAGHATSFELRVPYADGGERDIQASYVPDIAPDGTVRGFFVLVLDISTIKRAEAAARAGEEGLRAANRQKDEFIAMLAHELRNPLAAIALSAELLERTRIDNERARFGVAAIKRQTTHLRKLIDDLLDVARATYGKLSLARRPRDLLEAAETVAAQYRDQPANRVRFEVTGEPVWAEADPTRLHQIVDNLLENAIKYGARTVSIGVASRGEWAELAVADDGQGIAPDLLAKLFEPFVQGAQSIDRTRGGLGLGLALVKRLATLHGGTLNAESEGAGKGSRFVLRLPRIAAPEAPTPRTSAASTPRSPRRILVVEDGADTRESLRRLLELEGHQVALAANGPEGLARMAEFQPEVALVDIGLPGLDGYELARSLRAVPGGAGVRLIALTGYGQTRDRDSARAAGFDAHLTKPAAYDELLRAIEGETLPQVIR